MTNKRGQIREKRRTRLPFSPSPFWKPFNGNTQSPRSGSFIFKMAAMLQIPRVFPRVSCLGSAKAVQCLRSEPEIGDKSQQIPRYSLNLGMYVCINLYHHPHSVAVIVSITCLSRVFSAGLNLAIECSNCLTRFLVVLPLLCCSSILAAMDVLCPL